LFSNFLRFIDFLEGKSVAAIHKFNKQIEYFGDESPNVYYMLGLTYGYKARQSEAKRDWQHAEENFKKFLEFHPESPWTRTDLSWVYFSQGKYEEMVPVLEEGLEYEPEHPWLLNMYGLALLNTGERELANQYFLQAAIEADKLKIEDWGKAYPGNDPRVWEQGLSEFKEAIWRNIEISKS